MIKRDFINKIFSGSFEWHRSMTAWLRAAGHLQTGWSLMETRRKCLEGISATEHRCSAQRQHKCQPRKSTSRLTWLHSVLAPLTRPPKMLNVLLSKKVKRNKCLRTGDRASHRTETRSRVTVQTYETDA
ncbi:uncharacterized protein LOC111243136 isoform X3 [Varroa destructor]|uniref:Uncharacterized protein n=1 Tax=Varroa destructor TaxID=109461 RepID=A0A7M7IYF4_VARDE|nr:uncharacterized protein LOC111243136 isoform X3 [Varroa destructor]